MCVSLQDLDSLIAFALPGKNPFFLFLFSIVRIIFVFPFVLIIKFCGLDVKSLTGTFIPCGFATSVYMGFYSLTMLKSVFFFGEA